MPRIGLLSDSHSQAAITRRAVGLLLEHGAQMLLHLGDVGSEAVIEALAVSPTGEGEITETGADERQIEARLVFGNTDLQIHALTQYARSLGIKVDHPAGQVPLAGGGPLGKDSDGELVFCHGHDTEPMREAVQKGVRYLCHGHTHEASDTCQGRTRIINPGALHRARHYSVALLCTETDTLKFYSVPSR